MLLRSENVLHETPPIPKRRGWDANLVLPRIYLGSYSSSMRPALLQAANITLIISVGTHFRPVHNPHFNYLIICAEDKPTQNLLSHFERASTEIDRHLKETPGNVLVHCMQGVSRSATILSAYQIRFHNCTPEEAIKRLQAVRPQVNPNKGFRRQLDDYYKAVQLPEAERQALLAQTTKEDSVYDQMWSYPSQPPKLPPSEIRQEAKSSPESAKESKKACFVGTPTVEEIEKKGVSDDKKGQVEEKGGECVVKGATGELKGSSTVPSRCFPAGRDHTHTTWTLWDETVFHVYWWYYYNVDRSWVGDLVHGAIDAGRKLKR